jgi:hypothetical protein
MMFHWAPPEVNGFGVITSTPSFSRSSQVWMFSGFPGRTAKTTTESVTMPLYSFWFQSSSTRPASINRVMSGSSENATTSAARPASTARLCSPDDAYDWSKSKPSPSGVSWKPGMISS